MDYAVFKTKVKKPEPEPAPKPTPPAAAPPPLSPPYQGSIPFRGRGYAEDLDRMSRNPGMRDFEVTYSKTYRWNLMDSMEDYNNDHDQPVSNRGMQWLPLPPVPPPPRRTLSPQPEFGPPEMFLAPRHTAYEYPWAPPAAYGPYGGGGSGYYDYQHPDDCRVM